MRASLSLALLVLAACHPPVATGAKVSEFDVHDHVHVHDHDHVHEADWLRALAA